MTKLIEVVAAAIVRGSRVLVARRSGSMSLPGLWEFPGGKVEPGESLPAALRREVREELGAKITVGELATTTRHSYDFGTVVLHVYKATLISGTPSASEHSELRWCAADDLEHLSWAPADLPAMKLIRQEMSAA